MKKTFTTAQILNVTTGLLITKMDDIYEILNFLTQDELYTHQIPRALTICTPSLREQLPEFYSTKMMLAEKHLRETLTRVPKEDVVGIIETFIEKTEQFLGTKTVTIEPIKDYTPINPIVEMVDMMNKRG